MESESKDGKSSNKFIIILAILIILICVGGWLITSNVNKKEKENNSNSNSSSTNDISNYVYDADYSYENKHKEYSDEGEMKTGNLNEYGIPVKYTISGTHYLKDLKVPYINLNSDDAKKVNADLEKLYLQYAESFDKIVEDSTNNDGMWGNQILSYVSYFYEDKDIVSVLVVHAETTTSPFAYQYITYNFDVKTGKLLTYAEVLSKLGYNQGTTTTKAKELLKEKMDSLYNGVDLSNSCTTTNIGKQSCYELADADLVNSIKDGNVLFFVDNDGILNLLLLPYYDGVENGNIYRYVTKVNK